jgi:parvulin-like peptidyl-prolyl isomerase
MEREHLEEAAAEPRDRTKWIWLGVAAAVVAMVVALAVTQEPSNAVSQVRAEHILIAADMTNPAERQQALERAKDLREQLLKGADFKTLAREYSNDPHSSERGGDLGYAPRGTYETAFDDYVWNAKIGEIGPIVKGSRGWHIIRVTDRRLSSSDKYQRELQERVQQQLEREGETAADAPNP